MVCPIKTCWDLHRAFPEAELIIIDDNGHSALEPGISAELVKACDRVRDMLVRVGGGRGNENLINFTLYPLPSPRKNEHIQLLRRQR